MDIMIDLETMGIKPDASIASIGACLFSPSKVNTQTELMERGNCFYTNVDLVGQNRGLDPSTIYWWLQQSDEARQRLMTGVKLPIADALLAFRDWIQTSARTHGKIRAFWSKGANFDVVILNHAFDQRNIPNPMPYFNQQCMRTYANDFKAQVPDPKLPKIAHSAIDDAIAQAVHLQMIFAYISSIKNKINE